ncbi:MAG TPA: cell division protein FtsZ [Chitinophagaceae bacterium]|nr:cell division protein FtsZ [Chitinophagaceae bacterium]
MIHFDLPKEKSSIIKVIGVGGGGGNAVNHMYSQHIEGVNFIICNTDAQALANSAIPNRVQLGPHLTQGLGAGANPEIGRQATEESLEELKNILEVNTKMAFITAGMGGGTGTGGAPIISKICKDLGILTVGIVTTPFAYEGKKRQQQAEDGIKTLKQYVDTLLVISNDKLRHQFGNLKMKEAFAKADNVLATAAKCITDVINSTGQINVDFADVCTVMRNGGVAILGSAAASGENRAHKAIEEALNSPLLNDNDIRGAKWILININSAEGEHEFTMDEVEVIQSHLLSQAGEGTDVILGLGYDNTLGDKVGITLIATGFEYKDPFMQQAPKKEEPKKEEKIVMVLGTAEEKKENEKKIQPVVTAKIDPLAPSLVEEFIADAPMPSMNDMVVTGEIREEEPITLLHLDMSSEEKIPGKITNEADGNNTVGKMLGAETNDALYSVTNSSSASSVITGNHPVAKAPVSITPSNDDKNSTPLSAASGGYLARPSNIYAVSNTEAGASVKPAEEPVLQPEANANHEEEISELQMQLVERDDIPAADEPLAHQAQPPLSTEAEESRESGNEADEQKRRAAERLHKLRNLSFNVNGADPNNEFETVPAYIRRNMELYNSASHIESFYSSYEVKKDQQDQVQISTINTFLDGKKPD